MWQFADAARPGRFARSVRPARIALRHFEPNAFIDAHQGWLTLHICCGFVAPASHSLLKDGALMPMGWYVYSEIGQWTAEHHLDLGVQMADLLQTAYERNHLRNYNAWLNELDDAHGSHPGRRCVS